MGVNQSSLINDSYEGQQQPNKTANNNYTPTSKNINNQQRYENNNNNNNKNDDNNDDELNLFLQSMKLNNSTQSDLDILIMKINDRVIKNDINQGLQLLKQFVYIVIEPIHKYTNNSGIVTDSTTYNQFYQKYNIPSLNKLEELYQTVRMKSEEILRINNEETLVEISLILSIIQQIKFKLLNKAGSNQQLEDDEGLQLYSQFLRKQVLENIGPMIQELLKINQQISPSSPSTNGESDLKSKSKSLENSTLTLKRLLYSIVQSISHSLDTSDHHWKWNNILGKKFNIKLEAWNSQRLLLAIHNQSAFYIDQVYKLIIEKINDKKLLIDLSDANFKFEKLIEDFQYHPNWLDSIKYLFSLDEILNYLSNISEISNKYINFIKDNLESGATSISTTTTTTTTQMIKNLTIELNNMKGKVEEIMTTYVELEVNYFQLSFSLAIYRDNLRKFIYNLKNPQIIGNTQDILLNQQKQKSLKSSNPTATTNTTTLINGDGGGSIGNSFSTSSGSDIINFKISSMIDDIFFVFRKVIQRSILSLNATTTCSVINQTCSSFELNYIPFLEGLLQFTYQGDFDEKRDYFLIILNNLKTTLDYLEKIKIQLIDQTTLKFNRNENDIKMITFCINSDNFTSISKKIDQLLKLNLEKLLKINSTIINQFIWPIRRINFELKDNDFEIYEINDPFVMDFIGNLIQLLEPYKKNLLNSNLDQLIHLIASHIAIILEEHIMQSFFNQLGGIQLAKDLRKIIEFLCTLTTEQNVRHKFTKLSQISHLLTLDKVNDVLDYWGQDSGYNWKLNTLQIKQVLVRRSDFQKNSIYNLKLIEPTTTTTTTTTSQQQQQNNNNMK